MRSHSGARKAILGALVALAFVPGQSVAEHGRVPHLTLHAGEAVQEGAPQETSWSFQGTQGCVYQFDIYPSRFPPDPPMISYVGGEASIVIHFDVRPEDFDLWAWAAATPFGERVGPRFDVSVDIGEEPDSTGGTVWVARSAPPLPGNNYLRAQVEWPPDCGGRDGIWHFLLRALV